MLDEPFAIAFGMILGFGSSVFVVSFLLWVLIPVEMILKSLQGKSL